MNKITNIDPRSKFAMSRDGYSFDLSGDSWELSRVHNLNFKLFRSYTSDDLLENFRSVIAHYAINNSAAHTKNCFQRFLHYVRWKFDAVREPIMEIKGADVANYKSQLPSNRDWYVGVLVGVFKKWNDLGHHGLASDLLPTIELWKLKGNRKGEAIQLRSSTQGALTEIEFESLYDKIISSFEDKDLSLEDFALSMLLAYSGRRPMQLADLQEMDLLRFQAEDGREEFILNVPRRKQRGAGFRESFKPFALNHENGQIVQILISNPFRNNNVKEILGNSFPLFPNWKKIALFKRNNESDIRALPEDYFHIDPDEIRDRIQEIVAKTGAVSERTGEQLKISPIRFRRTVGTRAAREGHGVLLIAELLDHTDTQNAHIYVENIPEHVDAINRAVAKELAPIAQAFVGRLVDREHDAVRGDDPSSRIRTNGGKSAGTCGRFGFCGALAPISCYTCRNFQPWLDGPHEAVLEHLLSENDYIGRVTGDKQVAAINNRTILAVTQVIELCKARKAALGFSNE